MHAVNFDKNKTTITLMARDFVALAGHLRGAPMSAAGNEILKSLRLVEAVSASEAEDTVITVHLYKDEAEFLAGVALINDNRIAESIVGQIVGHQVAINVAEVPSDLIESEDEVLIEL